MSLYELLLVLHILAVAVWIGAGFSLNLLLARGRAGAAFVSEVEWFGARVFPTASAAAAATGLLLVAEGYPEIGDLWVILAIAGFVLSGVAGGARLGKLVSQAAAGDESALPKLVNVGRLDLLILVLVLADMVIKPGS